MTLTINQLAKHFDRDGMLLLQLPPTPQGSMRIDRVRVVDEDDSPSLWPVETIREAMEGKHGH